MVLDHAAAGAGLAVGQQEQDEEEGREAGEVCRREPSAGVPAPSPYALLVLPKPDSCASQGHAAVVPCGVIKQ